MFSADRRERLLINRGKTGRSCRGLLQSQLPARAPHDAEEVQNIGSETRPKWPVGGLGPMFATRFDRRWQEIEGSCQHLEDDIEVGCDVHRLGKVASLFSRKRGRRALAHLCERAEQGAEQIDRAGMQLKAKQRVVHI